MNESKLNRKSLQIIPADADNPNRQWTPAGKIASILFLAAMIFVSASNCFAQAAEDEYSQNTVSSQQDGYSAGVPTGQVNLGEPNQFYGNVYQQANKESLQTPSRNTLRPYHQAVITQYERDQMDQAVWSLGVPPSRRPRFNNFYGAEERARQSILDQRAEEEFELNKRLQEAQIDSFSLQ